MGIHHSDHSGNFLIVIVHPNHLFSYPVQQKQKRRKKEKEKKSEACSKKKKKKKGEKKKKREIKVSGMLA